MELPNNIYPPISNNLIPGLNRFLTAEIETADTIGTYYQLTISPAIGRWKWNGKNILGLHWAEQYLLYNTSFALWESDKYGFMITPWFPASNYNVVGEPIKIKPFSPFGVMDGDMFRTLEPGEFEICYYQKNRISDMPIVNFFARKMADIERTITANWKNIKSIIAYVSPDTDTDMSMQTIQTKVDFGEREIRIRDSELINDIKLIELAPKYYGTELEAQKQAIMNEYLTYMGINNVAFQKRERQIVDEVTANNDAIIKNREKYQSARDDFLERVSKHWPELEISCDFVADTYAPKEGD